MSATWKYVGWALFGGVAGAAVGLLTAPASGRETRRRLSRKFEEERDTLESQIRNGTRRLAQVVGR